LNCTIQTKNKKKCKKKENTHKTHNATKLSTTTKLHNLSNGQNAIKSLQHLLIPKLIFRRIILVFLVSKGVGGGKHLGT